MAVKKQDLFTIQKSELAPFEHKDPFLDTIKEKISGPLIVIMQQFKIAQCCILILNFSRMPEPLRKKYHTENLRVNLQDNEILINSSFIVELEAAIRTFNVTDSIYELPYFKSDFKRFHCVEFISKNPAKALKFIRSIDDRDIFSEENRETTSHAMMMALMYFICHEFGHIIDFQDDAFFGEAFNDGDLSLEQVVIRMFRHRDEFNKYGFTLKGFGQSNDDENENRKLEGEFRERNVFAGSHDNFYKIEAAADEAAIAMLTWWLNRERPEYLPHLLGIVRGLFAAGVYFWSRDLNNFSKAFGLTWPPSNQTLTRQMMTNRSNYLYAANLFGENHRFVLLRVNLCLDKVIAQFNEVLTDERQCDEAEYIRTHFWLLRSLMDTPVKIANVCCLPEEMFLSENKKLFYMQFTPINGEVQMVRKKLTGDFN